MVVLYGYRCIIIYCIGIGTVYYYILYRWCPTMMVLYRYRYSILLYIV